LHKLQVAAISWPRTDAGRQDEVSKIWGGNASCGGDVDNQGSDGGQQYYTAPTRTGSTIVGVSATKGAPRFSLTLAGVGGPYPAGVSERIWWR
jgi:hypothetical protein